MKYIQLKLPRCLLVLTERELRGLLAKDPELWKRALKRGKGYRRWEQMQARRRSVAGEADKI